MQRSLFLFAILLLLLSCSQNSSTPAATAPHPLTGTWKLLRGIVVSKGDTTLTEYTKDRSFIKIINDTHFAFLQHDTNKGKDSATAVFVAGGGRYTLRDSLYTEQLEYCNAREWEGNSFPFTVRLSGDTLTQTGVEKVAGTDINRLNTEVYVRMKKD